MFPLTGESSISFKIIFTVWGYNLCILTAFFSCFFVCLSDEATPVAEYSDVPQGFIPNTKRFCVSV